jgi:hypothetical protein
MFLQKTESFDVSEDSDDDRWETDWESIANTNCRQIMPKNNSSVE